VSHLAINKKTVAIISVFVIVLGLGVYAYQLIVVANALSVSASVTSVSLEGFNPPWDFYPDVIIFTIRVNINNPTSYSIEIDRIFYRVYIEDHYVGEGYKEHIYISPSSVTPIYLDFRVSTSDVLEIIADLLKSGDNAIDYRIDMVITIPIKLFGVIRIFSLDIPHIETGFYVIPVPGAKPQVKGVAAYWNTQVAHVGESVALTVKIPRGLRGFLEVVVMKDVVLWPDRVARKFDLGYVEGPKTIVLSFVPDQASSLILRGYYIKLMLNGEEIFVQPSSYPPRLKVYPITHSGTATILPIRWPTR